MPKLYMLIGVPGSGKTTWITNQEWTKNCVHISTDKIVEKYAEMQGKTYTEVFKEFMPIAVDLMTQEVLLAKSQNKDIIWDQTSTTKISRLKKFKMLPNYEHIAVVFPTPDREELDRRLSSRPGKIVPPEVVDDMIANWQEPTQEEGFKEIWYA